MMDCDFRIRQMHRNELEIALDWAAREGWNPGRHDADAFYSADPDGFLIGEIGGAPVATISAVRYGGDYGFIGLYIVHPKFRRQGYGLAIWQEARRRLHGRIVGLDGVITQQGNYRKSGFRLAYRHWRYRGQKALPLPPGSGVIRLQVDDLPQLAALDRGCFVADRRTFLQNFCFAPDSVALGLPGTGNRLNGYGVIRRCRSGWKIGPVFAPDQAGARELLTHLTHYIPANAVYYWDVPETNANAIRLAEEQFGMTPMFETARLYAGGEWPLPHDRIWGTTTLELG